MVAEYVWVTVHVAGVQALVKVFLLSNSQV